MPAGAKLRHGFLYKVETTTGTDSVPTNVLDYVRLLDSTIPAPKDSPIMLENSYFSSSISKFEATWVGRETTLDFELPLRGNGASNAGASANPLEADAILRSMGFAVTYQAESGSGVGDGYIQYAPVSASPTTATGYVYMPLAGTAAILAKLVACSVQSAKINMSSRGFVTLSGTIKGVVASYTDVGTMPAFTTRYASVKNIPMLSSTWSCDSYTGGNIKMTTISVDNGLPAIESHQAPSVISEYQLVDRSVGLEFDAINVLKATYDYKNKLETNALVPFSISVGATGNKITVTAPKVQYKDVQYSDDNGLNRVTISSILTRNSGDDEIIIKFS